MKEPPDLDTDPPVLPPLAEAELVRLRHEGLRRAAPAVQHEVNNALMVLASNLELLGRSAADGAPRRQLDRATEAMRRLDQTVRGFLDAARREALDPASLPPQLAVQQALPLLRVALGARFGFDLEAAGDVWPVALDRARLDLALLALVRDAAARMAPGARIVARAENLPPAEVALRLTLPPGADPAGEAARLLEDAAAGGRIERVAEGLALVWPRAAGRAP
jgi:signal transduction histidine kinase